MSVDVGVVLFPGTNCEHDVVTAVERLGGRARLIQGDPGPPGEVRGILRGPVSTRNPQTDSEVSAVRAERARWIRPCGVRRSG